MRTETYKNMGGDVVTSTQTALGAKLRGLGGKFPERVVIENTHEVSEYAPNGMPYYEVTFEYNDEETKLVEEKERLQKFIKEHEAYYHTVAFFSRAKVDEIDNQLKELRAKPTPKYSLNELAKELHEVSKAKGFYKDQGLAVHHGPPNSPLRKTLKRALNSEKLLLIISEVTEIVEELRKPNPDNEKIAEEYADVLIRLLDSVAANDVDIDGALEKKRQKNKSREYMHGGKRF